MIQKDPRTYKIIGMAMEVHKQLGCGFLEAVYQEAFAMEMQTQGVPFKREVELPVFYKEHQLNTSYRADFICYDSVIVELKALKQIGGIEEAQILNYLKATGIEIGMLLNFGAASLEYKRYIFTKK
ncbi:MAG: GxxExxY protein [Candidatus Electryonea clarkiae]|nr:GxxExxY protein [Candidatus Electryonea clarkiae]MDP8288708.1 GxxExxY protein [Candidatus Electryonea clarkiae]